MDEGTRKEEFKNCNFGDNEFNNVDVKEGKLIFSEINGCCPLT